MADLIVNLDEVSSASSSDEEGEEPSVSVRASKSNSKPGKSKNKKNKSEPRASGKAKKADAGVVMDSAFEFEDSNVMDQDGGVASGNWDFLSQTSGAKGMTSANPHRSARTGNLDAKIEAMRARILQKGEVELSDDEDDISDSEVIGHGQDDSADGPSMKNERNATKKSTSSSSSQAPPPSVADELFTQRAEIKDFFTDNLDIKRQTMAASFVELKLSRPLQRGVQALKYERPTPIQATVIPLALEGRDICASAQTGSGKTAAFLLPTLERLLFRGKGAAVTRVAIITPTRELATQIHSMLKALAQFTDVRSVLVVGGLSLPIQAAELKTAPDVVVCTPGRMIDHLRNSLGVHFDGVEILILDEADRLLGMGFTEEVTELVNYCPRQKGSRQTMLFSATMTAGVEELIKLSLHRPIRVAVNTVGNVAEHLIQEFVRIRPKYEDNREAIVLALCKRSLGPLLQYAKQRGQGGIIVFCNRKKQAHRLVLLFGLFGLRAAELHGNLTQRQRAEAVTRFKSGDVNFLIATDLAARGLDVEGVLAVINMAMPRDHRTYIHRVGRTARAGRSGRSITLVGEKGRAVLRAVMKSHEEANSSQDAASQLARSSVMKSRQVPSSVVSRWQARIDGVEKDLSAIMKDESLEKRLQQVEMEAQRASNLLVHAEEIKSRPRRTWFQSGAEKQRAAEADSGGDVVGLKAKPLKASRATKSKTKHARSGGRGGDGGEDSGDDTPRRAYREGKQKAGAKRGTAGSSSSGAPNHKKKKARWETGRNGKVGKEKRANNPTNY